MYRYQFNSGGFGSRFSLFPPVLKTLLMLNGGIFILQLFAGLLTIQGISLESLLMKWFALWSPASGNVWPWQLLTYQFMHGGFLHLFFNMLLLWMFGAELEDLWGSRRFATFYLLCGIGAGLVQLGVGMLMGGAYPTIGASGSIYGILLAFGLTFPDRTIIMFPFLFPIPARIYVFILAGIALISGLFGSSDGVAHFAHLGGALWGFLLLKFGEQSGVFRLVDSIFTKRQPLRVVQGGSKTTEPTWFRTEPPRPRLVGDNEISQEEIDAILDKISRNGYASLSETEKKKLYEASKKL
jgi:membrane associated rhomboid family serine protease